jgi:V/A-type H+-transporting ATPase subunit A
VSPYFKKLINALKQMNYSEYKSEQFHKYEAEVNTILGERRAQ